MKITKQYNSRYWVPLVVAAHSVASLSAATIAYDLRDSGQVAAIEAGNYTVGGVTLLMSTPDGALNQTSGGFGINHSSAGDTTDEIDGVAGIETIVFSFDVSGTLDSLSLSAYGSSDTFDLKKNGTTILSLVDQGTSSPDIFLPSESFTSSDEFSLSYTGGNGASLDEITITSVPEPSAGFCLALGGLTACFFRKNRKQV